MSFLEVKNLSYTYKTGAAEVPALKNISFGFEKNEIIGVIGHTGSGKSTLMQCLNGLYKPTDGTVFLDGSDIWENPKDIKKIRFRVGLVFQYPEYQLFEETVYKDIAFGPSNMGLSEEEIYERVLKSADIVGLKTDLFQKSPFDLSGGEKRRCAIAGIISMEPECLILDEPTAGLDPTGKAAILKMVKDYRDRTGSLVIIVSHSMEDMSSVCDRLLVLNKGEIYKLGTVHEVFSDADSIIKIGLDVPEMSKIAVELNNRGFKISKDIFTVNDMFNELMRIKQGKQYG